MVREKQWHEEAGLSQVGTKRAEYVCFVLCALHHDRRDCNRRVGGDVEIQIVYA
jgi:hypothetical protein